MPQSVHEYRASPRPPPLLPSLDADSDPGEPHSLDCRPGNGGGLGGSMWGSGQLMGIIPFHRLDAAIKCRCRSGIGRAGMLGKARSTFCRGGSSVSQGLCGRDELTGERLCSGARLASVTSGNPCGGVPWDSASPTAWPMPTSMRDVSHPWTSGLRDDKPGLVESCGSLTLSLRSLWALYSPGFVASR